MGEEMHSFAEGRTAEGSLACLHRQLGSTALSRLVPISRRGQCLGARLCLFLPNVTE